MKRGVKIAIGLGGLVALAFAGGSGATSDRAPPPDPDAPPVLPPPPSPESAPRPPRAPGAPPPPPPQPGPVMSATTTTSRDWNIRTAADRNRRIDYPSKTPSWCVRTLVEVFAWMPWYEGPPRADVRRFALAMGRPADGSPVPGPRDWGGLPIVNAFNALAVWNDASDEIHVSMQLRNLRPARIVVRVTYIGS